MYKALNYWVFGGFEGAATPESFIDFAAERGLDGVELTVGDALKPEISEAECRKIAAYAAERKIGLRTLATGFYWGCSLSSPDPEERGRAIAFTRNYLRIARAIRVETILVMPGAVRVAWDASRPEVPYREAWEYATASLRELLPDAEKAGVNIALENVWNRFLMSPMEWKFFFDQFDSDRIGLYFDVGNCCLYGRPADYVDILRERIKAVHLKNFTEEDCAGGLHGFGEDLMTGEVHFPDLFSALKKIGYSGPFTVEMIPFSRLPDLVLPDRELAEKTVAALLKL